MSTEPSPTNAAGVMDAIALKAAMRAIDAFLVDNRELELLNARLGNFNLLRVLRIERAELRHSNVLAWLLDPEETHGLGDAFLRRFLSRLLLANERVAVTLSPAKVELMPLSDIEVEREWRNIDILVRSASQGWALLIENKIGSGESVGQLRRYIAAAHQDMPGADVIPVFLTLAGEEPSEEGSETGFVALSHVEILELLTRLIDQHHSRIPTDARVFLTHYRDALRRVTMQDDELAQLCKAIYRRHREAIDMIVEYGRSSQVLDACEAAVRQIPGSEYVVRSSNRVWILPSDLARYQKEVLQGWDFLPKRWPVVGWFYYRREVGKLQATIEVGPFVDGKIRIRLIEALRDAGFRPSKGAFREEAKYTRLVTEQIKLRANEEGEPDEDSDYIQEVTRGLWKRAWAEGQRIVDVLKAFDWNPE